MISLNWMPPLLLCSVHFKSSEDRLQKTLRRHSLKSQLVDTYYFKDRESKLEIFYSKPNKTPSLCIGMMKIG